MYLPAVATQLLGKRISAAKNTSNKNNVGGVIFYAARALSNEYL
jgi:hypothetical protein